MVLTVNGEKLETDAKTLDELVKSLKITDKVMAAAVNLNVVKQADWAEFALREDDKVELLRFVGGGR